MVVTDDGSPNLSDSETIVIIVNEVNIAPVLDPVGNQVVDEGVLLSFSATASDADLPSNALGFSLSGAPVGAAINPTTGAFTWTPTEAQGPGVYVFNVVVADDGTPNLADSETITVTVDEANIAPVLDPVGNRVVDEGVLLSFVATASDADVPANGLTFSLSGAVPTGAGITPGGLFTWLPSEAQGPGSYAFDVVVTDDGSPVLNDSESITVTVNEVNAAPVIDFIADQVVDEGVLLSFTATAIDPGDIPANALTFSLSGAPAGAAIDPTSGAFTWTPTEALGPGSYGFDVVVTDDGTPNLNDSESITVTVNEANIAPVLDPVGDRVVDEGVLLGYTATASDGDVPADGLTFSLSGAPAGAAINPTTGAFTWTPTETQGAGAYVFDVVVTDDGVPNLADSETITVTVDEVNVAPVLGAIGPQSGDELTSISFVAAASDPDLPANNLTYSLSGTVPAGASINPLSGVLDWTPSEGQDGIHTFDVVVTDDGSPNLGDSETITVTVNEVNVAPVLGAVGDRSVDETALLAFTATATDADLAANTLTFSLSGAPAGAAINPSTGAFTWTPSEALGGSSATFDVVVTDDGTPSLNDSETITVTVNEVNVAPVLDPIGAKSVNEAALLSFAATASDSDLPADGLTFSLSGEPVGAAITSAGAFSWTPTEAQGPGAYVFDVVVTDDGSPSLNDSESITVTVNEVNAAPVLDPIGAQSGNEGSLLTFAATASDPADIPANALTFSLSGEPAGAAITSAGVFTWTPTEAQGPGAYVFDVVVTDDGTPDLADSESITFTVNEANNAPLLDPVGDKVVDEGVLLGFTATASDSDLPADGLTFSLSGEPAGAAITSAGAFTWTPTEAQGAGVYVFDVIVTDDGAPNLNDSETIAVTVDEVNVAPVLGAVGDKTVDELTLLSFTATATDADLPANTLTFSLSGAPAGAAINPSTGAFTWTPSEAQGPGSYVFDVIVTDDGASNLNDSETIAVTVDEVNVAPVLGAVGDKTVDELTLLSFTATATDADLPANTLTFSLSGEPAGAAITSAGAFTWTPTEAQGAGVYVFDVIVTDDGAPNLNDSETIAVTVDEVNVAPVLGAVGDKTVDELTLLSFTATATDADLPANTLTFSLSGEPLGALINPATGAFTWTPTEAQGAGVYVFDVIVTDDGAPNLNDSETIAVTVDEVNVAPVLGAVGDRSVDELTLLSFTATATDADLPANTLTFSLSGEPLGASINPATGAFTWTPTEAQGGWPYVFDVVVTDDGAPNLADSETITVTVNDTNVAPVLDPIGAKAMNEAVLLSFSATASDSDLPADGLTFSLSGGPPAGAGITPGGLFTWTPTEAQGPGSYGFNVVVTDDGSPVLNDFEAITVTVNEVNSARLATRSSTRASCCRSRRPLRILQIHRPTA